MDGGGKKGGWSRSKRCWCACVCSTLTHLCWWWLKFVNGGHPTLLPHESLRCLATWPATLSIWICLAFVYYLSLFLNRCFQGYTSQVWMVRKNQRRRGNLLHTHFGVSGGRKPAAGEDNFTWEASWCRNTYTQTYDSIKDVLNSLAGERVYSYCFSSWSNTK